MTRFALNGSNTVLLSCNFLFQLTVYHIRGTTHFNMNSIPISATRPTTGIRIAQVVGLTSAAYLAGKAQLEVH